MFIYYIKCFVLNGSFFCLQPAEVRPRCYIYFSNVIGVSFSSAEL